MLTFLRKTRRALIESLPAGKDGGSPQKYVLYAIGEILLIMIGIFLAIQVNNWNEERKSKIIERNALISLKDEFQKNKIDLQEHIQWKQDVRDQWDTFLSTISNTQLDPEQRAIRRPIASYINYIISNSVLNSLLTSGSIDNLKNDSLRHALTSWQDVVLDFQQFQEMHRDFVNHELMPIEGTFIPDINYRRYGFDYEFDNHTRLQEFYLKAYDDMSYQNLLLRNFYWINIQLSEIRNLQEKMNQIIRLMEGEIGSVQN